jgi:tRNA A-37 threonylcarbamoyl transferase component Bud32
MMNGEHILSLEIAKYDELYLKAENQEERNKLLELVLTKEQQRLALLQSSPDAKFVLDSSGEAIERPADLKSDSLIHSNVWIRSPQHAGYLLQKSESTLAEYVDHIPVISAMAWSRRWVAVNGSELACMDEEPTINNIENLPIYISSITADTVIHQWPGDSNFLFSITFTVPSRHSWSFRAQSDSAKAEWLEKLSAVHAAVTLLSAYDKVNVIGMGSHVVVHEVVDKISGGSFALRCTKIDNQHQLDRILREAAILQQISLKVNNPHVMKIEKMFLIGTTFYTVMPLLSGHDLFEYIVSQGHLSEKDSSEIIRCVLLALASMHQNGILHLNIKPENILFDNSISGPAKIVVTDFGLSRLIHGGSVTSRSRPTQELLQFKREKFLLDGIISENFVGTIGYISPEMLLTGYAFWGTDLYAVGVLLYTLLSGIHPFQGPTFLRTLIHTVTKANT